MSVIKISSLLVDNLTRQANLSSRLRSHYNFHGDYADPVQQLAISIGTNSYIRPHRHTLDPKSECLIALKGRFALVVFDDQGLVLDVITFGSESYATNDSNYGVSISPSVWHTVIALTPDSVLFEVKLGPFDPINAKELASWAPAEGSRESLLYLGNLRKSIGYI
jgi:cupin fold WbuC family metalloprotein